MLNYGPDTNLHIQMHRLMDKQMTGRTDDQTNSDTQCDFYIHTELRWVLVSYIRTMFMKINTWSLVTQDFKKKDISHLLV